MASVSAAGISLSTPAVPVVSNGARSSLWKLSRPGPGFRVGSHVARPCRPDRAGPTALKIFAKLCCDAEARGNLVADAYLAAIAIESGCEWISTDGDYARFAGLKWRRP